MPDLPCRKLQFFCGGREPSFPSPPHTIYMLSGALYNAFRKTESLQKTAHGPLSVLEPHTALQPLQQSQPRLTLSHWGANIRHALSLGKCRPASQADRVPLDPSAQGCTGSPSRLCCGGGESPAHRCQATNPREGSVVATIPGASQPSTSSWGTPPF